MKLLSQLLLFSCFFFFNDPPTPEISPLSLHDALPIFAGPPAPAIPELERLGVRRASLGPRVVQAALGLVRRAATELRERGTYETMADLLIPFKIGRAHV